MARKANSPSPERPSSAVHKLFFSDQRGASNDFLQSRTLTMFPSLFFPHLRRSKLCMHARTCYCCPIFCVSSLLLPRLLGMRQRLRVPSRIITLVDRRPTQLDLHVRTSQPVVHCTPKKTRREKAHHASPARPNQVKPKQTKQSTNYSSTHLHSLLIPILRKTPNLALLNLENRRGRPPRMPARPLDPLVRLSAVAALGRVPQQHVAVFGPGLVEAHDVQVRDARHDDAVRLRVVHGGFGAGESGGAPEPGVGVAEVRHAGAAGVFGRRVGDGHVFFAEGDIVLQCGVVLDGL